MPEEVDYIVQKIKSGDIEKYAWIVEKYQRDIWKIAAFMLQDIATTEDIVQQVFVKAYLKLDQYQLGRDFGAWLKAIAYNMVKEEFRKRSRESKKLKFYYEHLSNQVQDGDKYQVELQEALEQCKQQLPSEAAKALEMRYTQSLSFEEISNRLNRTLVATRQLLSRTRIMLRDCVKGRVSL